MTDRELMQQALEAFGEIAWSNNSQWQTDRAKVAITALRAALAQPEQEPVAWRYNGKLHEFDPSDWATGPVTPLYTSPPAKPWVGLTDDERGQVYANWRFNGTGSSNLELCRDIEAKLKEKNA